MEDREYSVSEAVRLTGVPSHVLRYWEEELQIAINRTNQGHRIYSEEDLNLFRQVKEWKEKGIQLKAIRVLLSGEDQDQDLAEQIWEISHAGEGKAPNIQKDSVGTACEEETDVSYEVILAEEKPDNLKQFESILKRMMEEVVTEQNEKLEQALTAAIREEIEELYMQYIQIMAGEAAASLHEQKAERGGLRKWLKKLLPGNH